MPAVWGNRKYRLSFDHENILGRKGRENLKQNSKWTTLKYLAYFTQIGLTLVMPPVLYTAIAWWCAERFGWGNWVVLLGLLLGVATTVFEMWKLIKFMEKKAKESEREQKP